MNKEQKLSTIISMTRNAQWERAKGELRAFLSIQGSSHDGGYSVLSYQLLSKEIETFITKVEDAGLNL